MGRGARAQQAYGSIGDAWRGGAQLWGKSGPASVNWINGGDQYSCSSGDEIHVMDPGTVQEKTVFNTTGVSFPGSGQPFSYLSFQWSHDSRHLVFRSNFRHIYRHSGISDYYIYDVEGRQLKQAAKDARSAELSPDGTKVGLERDGNLFA